MKPIFRWMPLLVILVGCVGSSDDPVERRANGRAVEEVVKPVFPDSTARREMVRRAAEIAPPLNSFLVSQGGRLAVEEYFHGMDGDELVNIKSASKSVLSALTGIALREGFIEDIDQPLVDILPRYLDTTAAPRKKSITLRHVLTMRACLETTSFHNYGEWVASSNWLRSALEQPMVCSPGSDMVYSTGNSHIMSAVLTETSGMSSLEFARRYLLGPLGIERISWDRSPEGYYLGGNNMALSPRALLTFGQMYLNDGRHAGQQIVPGSWIKRSWETYGTSHYSNHRYGFFWWVDEYAGRTAYFAWGYGGQYVFVVPALDLVAVFTSTLRPRSESEGHNEDIQALLEEVVIPGVTAGA